jgi:hypothetical protein
MKYKVHKSSHSNTSSKASLPKPVPDEITYDRLFLELYKDTNVVVKRTHNPAVHELQDNKKHYFYLDNELLFADKFDLEKLTNKKTQIINSLPNSKVEYYSPMVQEIISSPKYRLLEHTGTKGKYVLLITACLKNSKELVPLYNRSYVEKVNHARYNVYVLHQIDHVKAGLFKKTAVGISCFVKAEKATNNKYLLSLTARKSDTILNYALNETRLSDYLVGKSHRNKLSV